MSAVYDPPYPIPSNPIRGTTSAPAGVLPVFNVKDYGAYGDGVHDDTAAIQAAANAASNAANGGIVYLPPGRYAISRTITVTGQNVTLQGAGWSVTIPGLTNGVSLGTSKSVIAPQSSFAQNSYAVDFNNTSHMILGAAFKGITLDGDEALSVSNMSALHFGNAAFFEFADSSIETFTGSAVVIDEANAAYGSPSTSQMWLHNFWTHNIGTHGIWLPSGDFTTTVLIHDFYLSDIPNGNSIYIDSGNATGKVFIHDGEISGAGNGIWIAAYSYLIHDCNIARANDNGIYIAAGQTAGEWSRVHHNAVYDNDINQNGSANIYVETGSTNCIFDNNICYANSYTTEYGIYVADSIGSNGIVVDPSNYCFNHKTANFYSGGAGNNYTKWTPPSSSFTLPASGTPWTNDTGADGTLYVTGAGVVTGVVVQGVTVASSLSVGQSYFVPAGGTITFSYTTAPTLVFVGN